MANGATSRCVFICYSRNDSEWRKRLRVHLAPLEMDAGLEIWDDTCIEAGARWLQEIQQGMSRARAAVLLISADFFASPFINRTELPSLLARSESEGVVILPLIVSPSRFTHSKLGPFQAINDPGQPLVDLSRGKQEQILADLSLRIELLLTKAPVTHPAPGPDELPIDEAADRIHVVAVSRRAEIRRIEKAPISPFGTSSYRAKVTDGKGAIYCHASGERRGETFYVRKGIGWLYEVLLGGSLSNLGLPVSNEELADGTGYPTSMFEGGRIEWSPATSIARVFVHTPRGDQCLLETRL